MSDPALGWPGVPGPPESLVALNGPRAFYFSGEDNLRLTTFNSLSGVTLALTGRFLRADGSIEAFVERHVPNTDRTSATSTFKRGCGWLLDVQVFATAGTPRRGQCFAIVEVVRGLSGGTQTLSTLIQGYVTDTSRLGWPNSPIEPMASGAGVLRSIAGTNQAAGAEVSETVPTNARWRLHAFQVTLVSSTVAANREVALVFDDGATVLVRVPSGFTHVNSTTIFYSSFHHAPRFTLAQDTTKNFPLPRIDLQGGFRIATVTTALNAADDYGAPQLLAEEWIED